jgi:alkylated DNA repair dioxygenase AlkB
VVTEVGLQGSLFDGGEPAVDDGFTGLRRIRLDERSWVDHAPGWLRGSDELFTLLHRTGRFSQRTVRVWDRTVPEPRLTAGWSTEVAGDDVPSPLRDLASALSRHYDIAFDRIWVNLYRDGRDSVAWHGDRIGRGRSSDTMVAIVSFGSPRPLMLRPVGGGESLRFPLGHGDLVVMGGSCQRTWEHCIPKTTKPVGPRVSVQFRPRGVA